jgi:hypothetical protein
MQKDIKQIAENYFGEQNKEYRLRHRLAGTPQEYWTLALFLNGKDAGVFTSKSYSYILQKVTAWGGKRIE